MSTTSTSAKTAAARMYTIQKYRLSCVREADGADLERRRIVKRDDIAGFVKKYLADMPLENVAIVAMDNGNRAIGLQVVEGAVNQCALYPQNVFRFLLSCAACSFIIAHNHPGGARMPSASDWTITNKLKRVGRDLDVCLLDHIIIADDSAISLRDFPDWTDK